MRRVRNGSEATTAEQQVAIGAVAAAEIEAKQNNGPQALEYLSKAGKWTLDTTTKIGVVVAAYEKRVGRLTCGHGGPIQQTVC